MKNNSALWVVICALGTGVYFLPARQHAPVADPQVDSWPTTPPAVEVIPETPRVEPEPLPPPPDEPPPPPPPKRPRRDG